jgi:hypothetical protein
MDSFFRSWITAQILNNMKNTESILNVYNLRLILKWEWFFNIIFYLYWNNDLSFSPKPRTPTIEWLKEVNKHIQFNSNFVQNHPINSQIKFTSFENCCQNFRRFAQIIFYELIKEIYKIWKYVTFEVFRKWQQSLHYLEFNTHCINKSF